MRVLSIGEILWDVFGDGERLGGGPFNFAAHTRKLGHDVALFSAVGEDDRGWRARDAVQTLGLRTALLQTSPDLPTGEVQVSIDSAGQPAYTFRRPAAFDDAHITPEVEQFLASWQPAWIYHCTLHLITPPARALLHGVRQHAPGASVFYDINLRADFYNRELLDSLMRSATLVKLNDEEAPTVAALFDSDAGSPHEFCAEFGGRYGWRAACVTRGADGCFIWTPGAGVSCRAHNVKIADAVGAGDAFAAAFLHGFDQGWPLERIGDFANRVGAFVASQSGAVPDWNPQQILSALTT